MLKGLNNKHNIIFILIFLAGVTLRLNIIDFPLTSEETNRDHLIARHIVQFKEFPTTGPNNGTLPAIGNNPLYFYLLSIPLLVSDHLMTLSFFNFILQAVSIIIIYKLAKAMFGVNSGLIAALFVVFSNIFIITSVWIWQPYVMFFFVVLSYYLLMLGFKSGKASQFLYSGITFVSASSLHMSVMAIAPAYAVLFLVATIKKGFSLKQVGLMVIIPLLIFAAVNSSAFLLPPTVPNQNTALTTSKIIQNSFEFITKLRENTQLFLSGFNLSLNLITIVIFAFMTLGIVLKKNLRTTHLIILGSIVSFILISALLNDRLWDQHFYPIYPLFIILLAGSLGSLISKNNIANALITLFAFTFAINASLAVLSITDTVSVGQIGGTFDRLNRLRDIENITSDLAKEINEIKDVKGSDSYGFFKFAIYSTPENLSWFSGNLDLMDSVYWLTLEKELDYKFVTIKNYGPESGYVSPTNDQYIIIACLYFDSVEAEKECLNQFSNDYKTHQIERRLKENHYGQAFYVARKSGS